MINTFTLGLVVIVYLLSLAYLDFLGYKKATSASDYLVGGRQMNPFVMVLSYSVTFISASAIIGFGGVATAFDMGTQWLRFLNMFIGVVIAFIFFGLRTRRMEARLNVSTFPQLLDRYYRSRGMQVFATAVISLRMSLYAVVVIKGGVVFIEQIFQIDFSVSFLISTLVIIAYVIVGGMKGVMYTDALQAVTTFGCMLFLLSSLYRILDMGFMETSQALTDIAPLVPRKFRALGYQGWTAVPVTGSPRWYTLVTSLILGVGIGCLIQPQLVVRFVTVESSKQLSRGVSIGCFFLIITVGTTYHAGALSSLFFLKTEGVVATEAVKNMDRTTPYFINKAMLDWFAALFILCILSVSTFALSSQFHVMGIPVSSDTHDTYKPCPRGGLTNVIRLGVLLSILVSYIICYMLPNDITARGTSILMDICAVALLPAHFRALYWKHVIRQGVMVGLRIGTIGSLFALAFLHQKEVAAMGVCRWLFDKDVLIEIYPSPMIDPISFALPLSMVAVIVVSLLAGKGKK